MTAAPATHDAYPSRTGGEGALRERLDPCLHGPPTGALTDVQRQEFDHRGYLSCDRLLGHAEVTRLHDELEALRTGDSLRGRPELILEPDSEVIRSIFDVHRLCEGVRRLVSSAPLLEMVEELLGGEVYVHQSRVNFKAGFDGKPFYWHSDFETWHVEDGMPQMRALSVSLNLTANTPVNGPLMLIPGSHKHFVACAGTTPDDHYKQSLRQQDYGVPTREQITWLVERGGVVAPTGPAGAAVIFDSNAMHGSGGNITPWPRSNLFVVFNSMRNTLVEPFGVSTPRPNYVANREFDRLRRMA
jgi:ectoine hydroxylase